MCKKQKPNTPDQLFWATSPVPAAAGGAWEAAGAEFRAHTGRKKRVAGRPGSLRRRAREPAASAVLLDRSRGPPTTVRASFNRQLRRQFSIASSAGNSCLPARCFVVVPSGTANSTVKCLTMCMPHLSNGRQLCAGAMPRLPVFVFGVESSFSGRPLISD